MELVVPPVVAPPVVEIHPPVPPVVPVVPPVVVVPPPVVVVVAPERPIVLPEPLPRATIGNGLRDKPQSIAIAPADIPRLRKANALALESIQFTVGAGSQ